MRSTNAAPDDDAGSNPETADLGPLLPAALVWRRFGVTSMTLHRWLRDQRLGFPRPVFIGRYRYFYLRDIVAWEQSRPRTNPQQT